MRLKLEAVVRVGVTLAWGLWFGGLVALFLFATAMFRAGHALGASANPVMFAAFERYQMILMGVLLAGMVLWMILASGTARGRWKRVILILFVLAGVAATTSWLWVTPKIDALRLAGLGGTPAFKAAHGQSMMCYASATVLLLIGGCFMALERPGSCQDH